jgi:hypothetical protein
MSKLLLPSDFNADQMGYSCNPIRATKPSASGAPISLANAPKSPAIQGARMESFIWSILTCCVIIAFSKLACLQYFVGGHLGAITLVAPQKITLAPSA